MQFSSNVRVRSIAFAQVFSLSTACGGYRISGRQVITTPPLADSVVLTYLGSGAEVEGETILERCPSESGLSWLPCSTCSTERPTNRNTVQAREQRRSVFRHIEPLLALHRLFPC